jgi:putative ABC transport system ATP-binding protein
MIELRNIIKNYKMGEIEVQALRGVNLSISKGDMVAIMGPSGCGKSTLMNIMGCLDSPTSGTYRLNDIEINCLSDSQLAELRNKQIGFVFQTFNLLPRTSALDNVELPMLYGKWKNRKQRAIEALQRVGLGARINHRPSELSGGEQQRVAIARALINQPAVIIADEPTGNLDSKSSLEIMRIITEFNRKDGITIIIVTHSREIAETARRIISLRDGQIVKQEYIPGPSASPGSSEGELKH